MAAASLQPSDPAASWRSAWLIYAPFATLVCFAWLAARDVVSMEGIVADGARYMLRSGEWFLPHLYGQPYNYKPPLLYWLAAVSFQTFGEQTEWTLRLPVALSGWVAGAIVLFLIGRLTGPWIGCLAGCAAISGGLTLDKVRLAEFDWPLAAGVGVAATAACVCLVRRESKLGLWLLAYAALAWAALAKGTPALLFFVPGLLCAAFFTRQLRLLLGWRHLAGAALGVIVIAAYVTAVIHWHGLAAFQQPLNEGRALGGLGSWTLVKAGQALAKPTIALALFLPWTAFLGALVDRGWWRGLDEQPRRLILAAGGFVAGGLIAFMAVPSFQTRYYLPIAIPFGILAAVAIGADPAGLERFQRRRNLGMLIVLWLAGLNALSLALETNLSALGHFPTSGWTLAGLGAAAIVGALRWRRGRDARTAGLGVLLATVCIWAAVALFIQDRRGGERSLRSVAQRFEPHVPRDAPIWMDFDDDQSSLFFYLRRETRSFTRRDWPPSESLAVFFPQQLETYERAGGRATVLSQARGAGLDFVLVRLDSDIHRDAK